jgi:hypothetical protein
MARLTEGLTSGGGIGPMMPGDQRVVTDPKSGRTITITRTARPYVQDLCDAYNTALTRDDVEWFVTDIGELKLRDRPAWTERHTKDLDRHAERERQEWLRNNKSRPFYGDDAE